MAFRRIDFPGSRHHVYNRGVRRLPIFTSDSDRRLFLELLAELPRRFGVRVLAYALMDNHFHLLLVSERGNLSDAMRFLFASFVPRCNRRNGWEGPMFRDRFQNRIATDEHYWSTLLFYVHLNPFEAGMDEWTADPLRTSDAYYRGDLQPPNWLDTRELLELSGGSQGYRSCLEEYRSGSRVLPHEITDPSNPALVGRTGVMGLVQPPSDLTHRDPSRALDEVQAVTNASLDEILVGRRGRRSNQPRRLAMWWMIEVGVPRHRVAELTGLQPSTVASVASRVRRASGELAGWRSQLLAAAGWPDHDTARC